MFEATECMQGYSKSVWLWVGKTGKVWASPVEPTRNECGEIYIGESVRITGLSMADPRMFNRCWRIGDSDA